MYDKAFDEFVDRFGSIEQPDSLQGTTGNLKMGASGVGQDMTKQFQIGANDVNVGAQSKQFQLGADGYKIGDQSMKATGGASGGGGADIMGMVNNGIGLVQTFTGSGLETSAESGGPGKSTGHIIQGGAQGAQLGMQVGGPWGAAIGAVVGAGGGALAHGKAQREYYDNRVDKNVTDFAKKSKETRDDYRMSRGLASVADSKALLEKQLNVIS